MPLLRFFLNPLNPPCLKYEIPRLQQGLAVYQRADQTTLLLDLFRLFRCVHRYLGDPYPFATSRRQTPSITDYDAPSTSRLPPSTCSNLSKPWAFALAAGSPYLREFASTSPNRALLCRSEAVGVGLPLAKKAPVPRSVFLAQE